MTDPELEDRIRWTTRWFLTHDAYEAWKDTLPVRYQIQADLVSHVEHFPLEYLPNSCTACALNQRMMDTLKEVDHEGG